MKGGEEDVRDGSLNVGNNKLMIFNSLEYLRRDLPRTVYTPDGSFCNIHAGLPTALTVNYIVANRAELLARRIRKCP